jgi:hypothetical protein
MPTHATRGKRGTSDCSVTPDEYRSSVLIASSWTIAKARYGTANQPGSPAVSPVTLSSADFGSSVASAAPRISSRAEGIAPPSATAITMRRPLDAAGRYRK